MANSNNRQRALARAKAERQIARRAARARRRRQIQGAVGATLVVIVAVGATLWYTGTWSKLWNGTNPESASEATAACAWTPSAGPGAKDVGLPPTSGIPDSGTATMTIDTNQGTVEAQLDLAKAPCTAASFSFLASKQFYDDTTCHRLTTDGIYVLQCGDPSAEPTGAGGPGYRFADENLPTAQTAEDNGANLYPKGTLAMANSGPGTNGSQFFLVYKDGSALEAKYTVVGKITKGLDVLEKVAAEGVAGEASQDGQPVADGTPKIGVTITSLTVSAPTSAAPGETPSESVPSAPDAPNTSTPASPSSS